MLTNPVSNVSDQIELLSRLTPNISKFYHVIGNIGFAGRFPFYKLCLCSVKWFVSLDQY